MEFRINEDDDEDMPYTRPPDFQPKPARSPAQPRTRAARQKAALSRGADAVRALQAQQKAGAKREGALTWEGQQAAEGVSAGVHPGESGKDERSLGGEPSVGRGPTQSQDQSALPTVIDAGVSSGCSCGHCGGRSSSLHEVSRLCSVHASRRLSSCLLFHAAILRHIHIHAHVYASECA